MHNNSRGNAQLYGYRVGRKMVMQGRGVSRTELSQGGELPMTQNKQCFLFSNPRVQILVTVIILFVFSATLLWARKEPAPFQWDSFSGIWVGADPELRFLYRLDLKGPSDGKCSVILSETLTAVYGVSVRHWGEDGSIAMSFVDVEGREPIFEMYGGFGEYSGLRLQEKTIGGTRGRSVTFVRESIVTNYIARATLLMREGRQEQPLK